MPKYTLQYGVPFVTTPQPALKTQVHYSIQTHGKPRVFRFEADDDRFAQKVAEDFLRSFRLDFNNRHTKDINPRGPCVYYLEGTRFQQSDGRELPVPFVPLYRIKKDGTLEEIDDSPALPKKIRLALDRNQ